MLAESNRLAHQNCSQVGDASGELLTQSHRARNTMRVRSAQPAEERSLQKKSPKWVRQLTPSARLRDQSHDTRTTRRAQGRWTGTILAPSIQA
jgi:hypothetical protein